MKFPVILAASAFLISLHAHAADPAASAAPAPPSAPPAPGTPNLDLPEFATADSFWNELQKLQERPTRQPTSREEMLVQVNAWFGTQKAAADAFVKKFPEDPRRWQAKMISLRAGLQVRRFSGQKSTNEADQQALNEVINAPDAPVGIKGEAAFMSTVMVTGQIDPSKPETFAAFYKAADEFFAKFGDHPLAGQLKSVEMQVLNSDPTEAGTELLNKFAADKDPQLAQPAKALIAQRKRMTDLKAKPLDLKFTAVDGHPVDVANLRGKVVLVDFWASWCGPCMAEMPNVVATYQKLHEKGFEIVGISLDQDKAAMEGALKQQGMTWTQYFDGEGWKNKISSEFGITSIPAAWILDKKGILRERDLRGEALAAGIEKLLAE